MYIYIRIYMYIYIRIYIYKNSMEVLLLRVRKLKKNLFCDYEELTNGNIFENNYLGSLEFCFMKFF